MESPSSNNPSTRPAFNLKSPKLNRLLSPRKVHAVSHNTGVVDSAGTKRRLDEDTRCTYHLMMNLNFQLRLDVP